ncbi:MAG TPA: hypothetical protein VMD59_17385 [Acidimicrobiales bacterium]|nr:hypothetical protein [Acidimicrobiales bacterium]
MFSIDRALEAIAVTSYVPGHGSVADFAGDSLYVEEVYAGVVGPSALLTYRRLLRHLAAGEQPVVFEVAELAASIGVKRDIMLRSLERLVRFRFAHLERAGGEQLAIHTRIPIVSAYHFEGLSASARAEHYRLARELRAAV